MKEWIAVKDRLPEPNVGVLITNGKIITVAERWKFKFNNIKRISWSAHEWGGYEWDWDFDEDSITHWMLLPKLPLK